MRLDIATDGLAKPTAAIGGRKKKNGENVSWFSFWAQQMLGSFAASHLDTRQSFASLRVAFILRLGRVNVDTDVGGRGRRGGTYKQITMKLQTIQTEHLAGNCVFWFLYSEGRE